MTEEREVSPAQPEVVEVSQNTPPEHSAPLCGKPVTGGTCNRPEKHGGRHGIVRASLTSEELREHQSALQKTHRATKKEKNQAKSYVYDSSTEPTKPEAKSLLEQRGLKNPHVIDVVHTALVRHAENSNIPANRFLFQNGIIQTQRSIEADEAQPLGNIPAETVNGELLNRAELYALYDACLAPYEPETTFEQFLEVRLNCKRDTFYLGKDVFKNDFAECHKAWRDFFPQWDPITLPRDYTQRQAIDWLASQSEVKDLLLMASRRAFKSSFMRLWLLTAIITLPDIRILIVSETRPLSKDNIEAVRGYFEVQPGFETRFQRLFPEFCIPVGDGSVMSLEVPMRRLKLPQSIESSSMDSAVAGKRSDIIIFDDPISEQSCGNDEQIRKSIAKRDMLVKLKERGGMVATLGTPYAPQDLYYVQIERASKNEDDTFAYRIDPAFQVKPEARHKLTPAQLPSLTLDDIESFLFPEGLPWKELRTDMLNNPTFFLSQNLCLFPRADDEDIRCQFTREELLAATKHPAYFQNFVTTQVVMSLDRAFSVACYADYSALTVAKIQAVNGRQAVVVVDSQLERLKESQLAHQIMLLVKKHSPTILVLEKDRGYEELITAIKKECMMNGLAAPWFRIRPIENTPNIKAKRAKRYLELPLADKRLFFQSATWNDQAFEQLERFDGISRSSGKKKDDFVDSLSLLVREFMPSNLYDTETEEQKQQREQELDAQAAAERKNHFYNRMFTGNYVPPPKVEEAQPQQPAKTDPRMVVFGFKGPWKL